MMRDVRLLLWLERKRLSGSLDYWVRSMLGYRFGDESLSNRLYGFYLILIGIGWVFFMWAYAVESASGFSKLALTDASQASLAGTLPVLIGVGQLWLLYGALRLTPLKLSFGEMAYVAASPISRSAVALVKFSEMVLIRLIIFIPLITWISLLLAWHTSPEAGGQAGLQAFLSTPLLVLLTWGSVWVLGMLRLLAENSRQRLALWGLLVALIILAPLLPGIVLFPGDLVRMTVFTALMPLHYALLVALTGFVLWAMLRLAGRVNLILVADESQAYARIQELGVMAWESPDLARSIRQQAALARRGLLGHLPAFQGPVLFPARATLYFLRARRMALLKSIAWGVIVTEVVVLTVGAETPPIQAWAALLLFIVMYPPGSALAVFKNDLNEPFLRQMIPRDNLMLMLWDSAIPLILLIASGTVVWLPQAPSLEAAVLGEVLLILLTLLIAVCQGVGMVRMTGLFTRVSYQQSSIISFVVVLFAWLILKNPVAPVAAAGLMILLYAPMLRSSLG